MEFIVLGYDGSDDKAVERRLAVRDEHLRLAEHMYNNGLWLFAAGILDDAGKMIGSLIVCDFPSRIELEEQWLRHEPYVAGGVWKRIEVNRAQVAPFCIRK